MVATSQKDTAIGKAAADDARRMKDTREVAFLDWFAKQTPKRPSPLPGMGGGVPGLPNDLSDRPDIGLSPGLGLDNLGTVTPTQPGASFPAPAAAVPTTAPPDSAAADTAKPENAKPADAPPPPASPATSSPPESTEKKSE